MSDVFGPGAGVPGFQQSPPPATSWPPPQRIDLFIHVDNGSLSAQLSEIQQTLEVIMSEQANVDADAAAVTAVVQELSDAVARIEAEIGTLQAAGVDTSALDAQVASLKSAADAVAAVVPAPAPAPAPDQPVVDPTPAPDQPAEPS